MIINAKHERKYQIRYRSKENTKHVNEFTKNLGSKPVVQAIQCLIRKLEIINETPVHNIITTLPRIPFHIREVINLTLLYTSHKNEILSTNIVKYVKDEISIPKTIKNIVVAKIPIAPIWRRKLLTTVNL